MKKCILLISTILMLFGCSNAGSDPIEKIEYYQTDTIPLIVRDFRGYDPISNINDDGVITAEHVELYRGYFKAGHGHPDFERSNANEKNIVKSDLGDDGLPVFNKSTNTEITNESFQMWYRDFPGINLKIEKELSLNPSPNGGFEFKSSQFFPINGEGYGNLLYSSGEKNYSFTDIAVFYVKAFEKGNSFIIEFDGDDDVWIFINGKLAIDLGGCHYPTRERVTINSTSVEKDGVSKLYNSKYDILEDDFVEIKIFHAERHTYGSNYNLYISCPIYQKRIVRY